MLLPDAERFVKLKQQRPRNQARGFDDFGKDGDRNLIELLSVPNR